MTIAQLCGAAPLRNSLKKLTPKVITLTLVIGAGIAAYMLFTRWQERPWTRDGQVRADVVKVAPRVGGYVVEVAVHDNQFVKIGELLFRIEPRDYQLSVDRAEAKLDEAREDVESLEAALRAAEAGVRRSLAAITSAGSRVAEAEVGIKSAEAGVKEAEAGVASAKAQIAQNKAQLKEAERESARAQRLADQKADSVENAESKAASVAAHQAELDNANAGLSRAQAALARAKSSVAEAQAKLMTAQNSLAESEAGLVTSQADRDKAAATLGVKGDGNVRIRETTIARDEALLKLDWTKVYAPCDGYVSNLSLREGTYASAGSALVAFVDSNSFRVHAYFQETKLRHIRPGDRAVITLMSHRGQPIEGIVDTIANATNPPSIASTEGELGVVPQIQPTFDWVRLAQRVPVRIRLTDVPEDVQLISGTTASISIEK